MNNQYDVTWHVKSAYVYYCGVKTINAPTEENAFAKVGDYLKNHFVGLSKDTDVIMSIVKTKKHYQL